jgi:hypothetical protein
MKIFKYILKAEDKQVLTLPLPAKILSVAEQFQNIVLYAMVYPDCRQGSVDRTIYIVGTGHDAEHLYDKTFIGTVKLAEGALMFHIFTDYCDSHALY